MEYRKDDHESDLREVVEELSKESELDDPGFWREYFYWSWRCLLFVLFIVVATNIDFREGMLDWFDHISPTKWVILVVVPLLIGPVLVLGWSYMWTWGRDVVDRSRR